MLEVSGEKTWEENGVWNGRDRSCHFKRDYE